MQALIIRPMGVQALSALVSLGDIQFPLMRTIKGVYRIPCTLFQIEVDCGMTRLLAFMCHLIVFTSIQFIDIS